MKHLRQHTLLLLIFWTLTAGCSGELGERGEAIPWSDLDFLNRQFTTLTFVNASKDSVSYYIRELQDEFYRGGFEGALPPGDSVVLPMKLWRPECSYLYLEGRDGLTAHLFPGFHRTLIWNDGFSDRGAHAASIYSPLRLLDQELEQQGPSTPVSLPIDQILSFYRPKTAYFDRITDSLKSTGNHPDWLPGMLRRQAHLIAAGEIETIRGYRRMAYLDTFNLPPAIDQRMDSLLTDPDNLSAPNYRSFLNRRMFISRTPADTLPSPRGAGHGLTQRYLTENFLTSRPGMLAAFLEEKIHSTQQYGGKDDLIERGMASLPMDYQEYLKEVQQTLAGKNSNDAAVVTLLRANLQTPDGRKAKLSTSPGDELALYKFWFPGCAPCVRQYPYEKKLLAEFPNLELTYIGYLTPEKVWSDYVANNDLPTSRQYFLPNENKPLAKDALGVLGAPRYVLIGDKGEVLCRACPKPDDPSLRSLIREGLN